MVVASLPIEQDEESLPNAATNPLARQRAKSFMSLTRLVAVYISEMLDAAAIALLVMTAEDEIADGGLQARLNVVHGSGLFQGRLG